MFTPQFSEIYPSLCLFLAISATSHQIPVMSFTWMSASLLPEWSWHVPHFLPPVALPGALSLWLLGITWNILVQAWHTVGSWGSPEEVSSPTPGSYSRCHMDTCPSCLQVSALMFTMARFPPEMPTGPCHPTGEPRPHTPWPIGSGGLQIENVPNVYWLCPLASKSFGFTFPHKESYSVLFLYCSPVCSTPDIAFSI